MVSCALGPGWLKVHALYRHAITFDITHNALDMPRLHRKMNRDAPHAVPGGTPYGSEERYHQRDAPR
ncbi:hypothetical protein PsYK624_154860 [Phanerochaete sordida]|uniref:Uncharacterized protein n=1 Tax=Phanerochaete sordida TaxID=48140 RepID=A0A9P3LL63_9APHY|nr:hypothetical protein PsYK624_154860 [Phanerochaete sordida]